MKIKWLQPVATDIAHLCVVDDKSNCEPVCGAVLLTNAIAADAAVAKCADCERKWKSGEAITVKLADGTRMIVRPAGAPIWQGSLDPFQDMAEELSKLGVAYMLVVGIQGEQRTRYWTNVAHYGHEGVASFKHQVAILCDRIDAFIDGEKPPNDGA